MVPLPLVVGSMSLLGYRRSVALRVKPTRGGLMLRSILGGSSGGPLEF